MCLVRLGEEEKNNSKGGSRILTHSNTAKLLLGWLCSEDCIITSATSKPKGDLPSRCKPSSCMLNIPPIFQLAGVWGLGFLKKERDPPKTAWNLRGAKQKLVTNQIPPRLAPGCLRPPHRTYQKWGPRRPRRTRKAPNGCGVLSVVSGQTSQLDQGFNLHDLVSNDQHTSHHRQAN